MPLLKSDAGKIHSLKNCITYLNLKEDFTSEPRDLRHDTIVPESWDHFRIFPQSTMLLQSSRDMTSNQPPELSGSSGSSSYQLTPVEAFRRSIKRDSVQFTNLKDTLHWDAWRKKSPATVRAPDFDKFLYLYYTPRNQEEINLFKEKQKFVFSVFSATLKNDRGKKFVREHEQDFDTQTVYNKFHRFHTTSAGS